MTKINPNKQVICTLCPLSEMTIIALRYIVLNLLRIKSAIKLAVKWVHVFRKSIAIL